MGVAFGPGYALIRLQALGAGPVSAFIPNAEVLFCAEHREASDRRHAISIGKVRY